MRSPRFQHDSRASGEKPVGHSTPACLAWGTLPSIAHHASSPPDALQRELVTTQHLLAALDVGDLEENVQVLDLLSELKDVTEKKDLELRRYLRKCFKKEVAPCLLRAVGGCPVGVVPSSY